MGSGPRTWFGHAPGRKVARRVLVPQFPAYPGTNRAHRPFYGQVKFLNPGRHNITELTNRRSAD